MLLNLVASQALGIGMNLIVLLSQVSLRRGFMVITNRCAFSQTHPPKPYYQTIPYHFAHWLSLVGLRSLTVIRAMLYHATDPDPLFTSSFLLKPIHARQDKKANYNPIILPFLLTDSIPRQSSMRWRELFLSIRH